mmetsp:Transcript_10817/g.44847  ORF Transcript_10817/g.44847 Transcript_10817/m.44847 type:complete len:209 (+) Transcript_10817:591-1217(+)
MRSGATPRSSPSSALPLNCSCSSATVCRFALNVAQSTTVTHVSSRATSLSFAAPRNASFTAFVSMGPPLVPSSAGCASSSPTSYVKVSATSCGSLTPVDSTTMASYLFSAAKSVRAFTRSSRNVQQMQPLCSSTSFASCCMSLVFFTRLASMFSAAMSFTSTAHLMGSAPSAPPCACERMRFSSVVLPAPRKPERTVTGTAGAAPASR